MSLKRSIVILMILFFGNVSCFAGVNTFSLAVHPQVHSKTTALLFVRPHLYGRTKRQLHKRISPATIQEYNNESSENNFLSSFEEPRIPLSHLTEIFPPPPKI